MSASEVATGYVSIMPSTKGFRERLASELKGSVSQPLQAEAKSAASTAGKTLGTELGRQAGAATAQSLRVTLAPAVNESTSSLKRAVQAYGGGSAVLAGLGQRAGQASNQLRGLVLGSSALNTASGTLKAGLTGVSGLLGGPWGIAVGGAALLINHFAEKQQEAAQAADDLYNSLDKQTGKLTAASVSDVVAQITKGLDVSKLQQMGINLRQVAVATIQGGDALKGYTDQLDRQRTSVALRARGAGQQRQLLADLADAMRTTSSTVETSNLRWAQSNQLQRIANDVVNQLGINASDTAAAIRSIPSSWTVAVTTNLAEVANQAVAAARAIQALQGGAKYSAGAAVSDYLAGIQSGKYQDPIQAAKDARNARIKARARVSSSRAGGGSSRSSSSAADTLRAARATLAADRDGLIQALTGDVSGARGTLSGLLKDANAAGETSLTRLIRSDTGRLVDLARQRASITTRLQNAQQGLANLVSQRNSTASSVSQSALGDLVGARSVGGVTRVVTKELELVKSFRGNLRILAKRGLPAPFLQQLIAAGVDGAATAKALANSSDSDFRNISSLVTQLNAQSTGLGKDASSLLYQPGIDAAEGLAKGLRSQIGTVDSAATDLATVIKKAITRELKIHSPSRVFMEYGAQTAEGFALGVTGRARQAHDAMIGLAGVRPSSSVAPMYAGAPASAGVSVGTMNVTSASPDPRVTARMVSDELVWRAKR